MNIGCARKLVRYRHSSRLLVTVATILALCASLSSVAAQPPAGGGPGAGPPPAPSANVSVFATGLESPRGLKFGPDGNLYVAEGGLGGTISTVGQCDQVPEIGPYTGGKTARISKIDASGKVTTVAQGLPSTRDGMGEQSSVSGVSDVEFIGTTLYALVSGGGCSHGNPDVPNEIVKINADGSTTRIADLSAWAHANPTKVPSVDDFEPDGDWYSMVQANGAFYALDPNRGDFIRVTLDGQITRIADLSAEPWVGPTTVIYRDGDFYISNLGEFPVTPGNAKVYKVTPAGQVSVLASGLEAVLGLAYDSQGRLYALQMSTVPNQGPVPGSGNIVRQTAAGTWEPVATGLFFPTGMTFGPDGALYVSNMGFGPPTGQIVKVKVNAAPTAGTGAPAGPPPTTTTPPAATTPPSPPSVAPALPPAPTPNPRQFFIRRLGDG